MRINLNAGKVLKLNCSFYNQLSSLALQNYLILTFKAQHSLLVSAIPHRPVQKGSVCHGAASLDQWTFCQAEMSHQWSLLLLWGSTVSTARSLGPRTSGAWWIFRNRPSCSGPLWCSLQFLDCLQEFCIKNPENVRD